MLRRCSNPDPMTTTLLQLSVLKHKKAAMRNGGLVL